MPFFVENACDEYGNRAYTDPQVVEGDVVATRLGLELVFKPGSKMSQKWPSVMFNLYGGWTEVEGPARPLTFEERDELIAASKHWSRSRPKGT